MTALSRLQAAQPRRKFVQKWWKINNLLFQLDCFKIESSSELNRMLYRYWFCVPTRRNWSCLPVEIYDNFIKQADYVIKYEVDLVNVVTAIMIIRNFIV